MTDEELYQAIAAKQAIDRENVTRKWGPLASAMSAPAAPKTAPATVPNLVLDAKVAADKAELAARMDEELLKFLAEVEIGRVTPGHRFFVDPTEPMQLVMDAATGKQIHWDRRAKMNEMLEKIEIGLIEHRLEAGLPAEPVAKTRKTPAQIAQERYNARHNPQPN